MASSLTEVARLVAVDDTPLKRRVPFFIASGILILLIVIAGVFLYQSQEQQARVTATEQLRSISSLKADEIARWRSDRIYDARTISASGFFIEGVSEYLSSPSESNERVILTRFREINQSVHYHNVILVDPNATVILSLDPRVGSISPMTAASVTESLRNGTAVMTDFHLMPGTDQPHLDVVAPLISSGNGSIEPVGAVILSIDPDAYLYPFIESWPVPTRSAETLLVERQGDHVLFLNDLRHIKHTALNLTIPLTQTDVPAVMAVLGKTGDFEGRDYRGVRVISDIRPVPGSPWFMVAKVDTEEAFASWAAQSILIIIIGAGLLGGILIATAWIWQRGQKLHYQSLYALEEEKKRAEQISRERAEALLHLAGMETATGQELAEYVMDAACRLTGSTLAFVGTMSPDESVFDLTAWSRSAMDECEVSQAPLHFPVAWAGIWADAVRRREPVVVNDYAAPLSGKKGLPAGHVPIHRFVSVPIFEGHRVVMICAVANKATEYLSEDVDQLVLLMQGVWGHFQKRAVTEALQKKHADLEAAYEEITATQEELQANYEELAKSQQALHESERKYRNLYQFAQVGLFETSLKDALVVACNQRYCDLFGFPDISAAIGKDVLGLYVNPSERKEVSRVLHEQGYIENHVVRFRNRLTGRPFWGQFSARLNREKDVAEGSIIDITAQKEAEAKLRETNAYLSNLFDYANAPIVVWDPEFRITRFNHAFERLTGWKSEVVIGEEVSVLFPERTRERSMAYLHQAMAGERLETVEIPILRNDGSVRILLWNSATLFAEDGKTVIAAIAQGQDISDLKAAEEERKALISKLEQKNAELERFTYTVSHDLKSPLITIRGFAGLLEEDTLKGDITRTQEDISRIIAAADKMQHLLTDLLNLSRIGRLVNPPEDVPLCTIVQEAVDLLAGPIREHGVHVEIAPNLPTVHVDHTRIREVYTNLIENAIKFTKRVDHPAIEAGMREEKGEIIFFVRDNGIGIEPRYLSKIFGLFEKLDGRSEGTGIGLAIVKRIIDVHGGHIWAESEGPGKGTTICFTLPLNSEQSQ